MGQREIIGASRDPGAKTLVNLLGGCITPLRLANVVEVANLQAQNHQPLCPFLWLIPDRCVPASNIMLGFASLDAQSPFGEYRTALDPTRSLCEYAPVSLDLNHPGEGAFFPPRGWRSC